MIFKYLRYCNQIMGLFKIKQPLFFLNKELYNDINITQAYKIYMYKIIQLFNTTNKSLKEDVDKIYDLEKELALV